MIELYVIRKDELILIKPLGEHTTIGRSLGCDICLPGSLRPTHASVEVVGSKVRVKELEGAVFFNGKRITGSTALQMADIFDLGEYRIQINKKTTTNKTISAILKSCGSSQDEVIPVITFKGPVNKSFCQLSLEVGRSTACDLVIPDDAHSRKNVSRRHMEIYVRNGSYYARDLQSKNGTKLFDYTIDSRPLPRRGTLSLGKYELPYEIEHPTTTAMLEGGILIPSINPNLAPKRILGNSPTMMVAKEKLDRALANDGTVLILGENGCGKELFARYLHFYHPKRKKNPFVPVNCAAIPKQLAETMLFGHVRGSFTGAVEDSKGVFVQAHGGTLFLDEIGELPSDLQAQLLRVLEDKLVRPVGSKKTTAVDVRVIFATNRDIDDERLKGRFRDDLYHRCQSHIRVPALREPREDIPLLIEYFLAEAGRPVEISPKAKEMMQQYPWPGNVRELSSAIERGILSASFRGSRTINENDLELEPDAIAYTHPGMYKNKRHDALKETIIRLLKETKGNVCEVATTLNLGRKTLYRKMEAFKIDPSLFRT